LLRVVRHVDERHNRNRWLVGQRQSWRGQMKLRRLSAIASKTRRSDRHPVGADWASDVFQRLCADVLKGEIEPTGDVLLHSRRHADAPRVGQTFKAGGDITPSPKMSPSSTTTSPW